MVAGGRSDHASCALDAPRERALPHLHGGVGCVELWSGAMGDIYLWQAAVVRALQS